MAAYVVRYPTDIAALFYELKRILTKDGRIVSLLYISPDTDETISALKENVICTIGNFHAFKMRLAMALAAQQPVRQICVESILDSFNELFKNRDELVRITAWSREQIDTIDSTGVQTLYSICQPQANYCRWCRKCAPGRGLFRAEYIRCPSAAHFSSQTYKLICTACPASAGGSSS